MFQMQLSSSVGKQRGSEPSKEKLRIQNIVETLCPRLCEAKAILQEIIWVLTPGRYKKMTQALAERAVEVTSNISHMLEGAEETSELLDNILQLEQTLRDIYVFVQSETQRNLLLRILFAKDLRVRYFSLDKQLRGLLNPFEQTVTKKPLVLCATIQEDHPGIASPEDVSLAEIVPSNSGSFFNQAKNLVLRDTNLYNAQKLVVKQVHSCDRTPQGIVEGAEVFTFGDVLTKKEIYKGRGYRVYSGTAKAKAVKIKLYEGSRAKDRCLAAARFSESVMHPNVLNLIGVPSLTSKLPFLVFDESFEWAIESIIASALGKGLKQSLFLGLQTVAGLSSGLDYLRSVPFPFASVGLDDFVVTSSHHGNILISFDPEILPDEAHERDQSDSWNELDIFHGLCQKTFDAACKAHYEFQKVQRSDLDELDADHDLHQDRFEEIEVDAETPLVHTEAPISEVFMPASPAPQRHATSISAPRRELVWKSQKNEMVSLEEIANQFKSFLLTSSRELEFNRRRGRYTSKTAHRCPGYSRIEITLTPDIARSAIVSHLTPTPHEICPVCKEIVKEAEIFACICGREDDESIPTIRCSTCSEWHHRPCVSISENEVQSFVCLRCGDPGITQRLMAHMLGLEVPGVDPLPYYYSVAGDSSQAQPVTYPSSAGFTNGMQAMNSIAMYEDAEGARGRYAQTEETSLHLTPTQPSQSPTPGSLGKQRTLAASRRMIPYPSPNASPRVRYTDLDSDLTLGDGDNKSGILKKSTSGKHVHFTSNTFPETPPLTFSSMSLPSSGGPRTPESTAGSSIAGHVSSSIHPLLSITQPSPMLKYDVSHPPSTIKPNVSSVPPHTLNEPATNPPIPSMVIRCPHLPWTITILPTSTTHVTVHDVFIGIYRSLRLPVIEAEFQCLPSAEARYSVNNAYIRRCKRLDDPQARELEKSKGLKHVDFLGERTHFTGLSSTTEGPHVWFLIVS